MTNNNRTIIRKLSKRCFLANKTRNLFALAAIVLTGILITAVFTIGISLMDGMKQMMIQSSGRSNEVDFEYLTQQEVQHIATHPLIKEYGLSKIVATTDQDVFRQKPCEIRTTDENYARFTFNTPTTGRLPKSSDEIALKSWILDAMGLPRILGQSVHLDFTIGKQAYSRDFTVCGFWDSDINLQPYGTAFVSEQLADQLLAGIDAEKARRTGDYSGVTQLAANLNGTLSELEKNVNTILLDTAVDRDITGVLINRAYLSQNADAEMMAAMALIILVILVSGYLLIYNIFYISVIHDIKFYGLLKTIGTTRKQLSRIVNFQALLLCAIGIPIGLLLGYLLGILLIPVLLSFLSISYTPAPPNPWIFMLATLVALFTVIISCHNPAKTAARISPIEAVRYTGVTAASKKKIKHGKRGAKISHMAWSNLLRNKKKAALVVASISIGLILFNIVFTLVSSFDINKYLQGYINGDFLIADAAYFNLSSSYSPSYTLTEDTLSEIQKLNGVEHVAKVYFETGIDRMDDKMKNTMDAFYQNNSGIKKYFPTKEEFDSLMANPDGHSYINAQVYGFDEYWLDKLEENVVSGTFDRQKFLSGEYIVIGYDGQDLFQVGDTVSFSLRDKDSPAHSYKILAKVDKNAFDALSAHFVSLPGYSAYLPSSELQKLDCPNIMSATVIAKEDSLNRLQTEIGQIVKEKPEIDFRSRTDYIAEMKSDNQQFGLIGFTLCSVILLIGILNFVNTTMTNIFSRKQELAILQSIGMTNKQSKRMLVLEGIFYVIISLILFIVFGYPLSYVTVMSIVRDSAAYTYHFSWVPLLTCFPLLLVLAYLLPLRVYKNISHDSIVTRLGTME